MKHALIVAAAAALLTLTACSGDKGPTKEDGVKVVEGFFTEQGRQATLQRTGSLRSPMRMARSSIARKSPMGIKSAWWQGP